MRVTVAIAVYNGESTLRATLESVLGQSAPPDEILVVNDGSTDGTKSILNSFGPVIKIIEQENRGLAFARNVLCQKAEGDLIAFLDADDIWHPRYLEVQRNLFRSYPSAVAFFTGHVNFHWNERPLWDGDILKREALVELIGPADFFRRYTTATGPFASPSYCCVPKSALRQIGDRPFDESLRICDDAYLFYLLALYGPIVYSPERVAAYRLTPGSLSSNRLNNLQYGVNVFKLLEDRYSKTAEASLLRAFQVAFAAKRREYAKVLMGAGQIKYAQSQLCASLRHAAGLKSMSKSLALLFLSYMPTRLQPDWPLATIR